MNEEHPLVGELSGTPTRNDRLASQARIRAAAAEYYGLPEALHGDRPPSIEILSERPVHRMMIYMHAQGASIADIAQNTGYAKAVVGQILRQPWARQRLLQILNETGRDAVRHFLTNEIAPSLEVLREVRDDTEEKGATRIIAADKILDRALGKATVTVESNITSRSVPADLQRIEADLQSTREQLAARGVSDGAN